MQSWPTKKLKWNLVCKQDYPHSNFVLIWIDLLTPNFYFKIMNNYKGGNIGIKARSMGNLSSHNMNISWPPWTLDITFPNYHLRSKMKLNITITHLSINLFINKFKLQSNLFFNNHMIIFKRYTMKKLWTTYGVDKQF
jgi:hypothetical protein